MNRYFVLLLLLCSSLARVSGQGSFTATWNFDNSTPEVSSITGNGAPNLNGQDAVFGPGVGEPQGPEFRYPQGNPSSGKAYSGDEWTTSSSPDESDYLQFCVDTDPGTVFNPGAAVGIRFDERRSGTGPRAFEVRASTDDFDTFTSLVPLGSMPDNTSWRSQGPYSFTIPASPVVTEVCFRIYGYSAEGNTGTWRFDNVQISGPSSLPVTWLSFEARADDSGSVALDWATTTETQNDHFAVERSADGARYQAIGHVNGAGTSTVINHYAYTDENPLPGVNYYRLRQVDFDGSYTFSRTVAVTTRTTTTALAVFPNPATDYITVQLAHNTAELLEWRLIDAGGRTLRSGTTEAARFDLPVYDLPAGLYGLQVVTAQGTAMQPFLRQ